MITITVSISSRNDPPQILRMLFLLPVLLVASLASADQMPAQWLGKYKLYKVMMIIFLMQASTSLRPARASPPSCPRLGWTGSQDRQAFDFWVFTICKQTFCQSRLLVPSTQLPQTRTWEGTEWGSTPRPRSSPRPSSSSSECPSMRPLVMELKWGLQQLWVETLWSRTRYTLYEGAFRYFPLSQLPHQSSAESHEVKRGFEDRDTELQEQRSDYGAGAHHSRQGQH